MSEILSLDLGRSTGWCLYDSDAPIELESGTFTVPLERGESKGMMFLRWRRWLTGMIKTEAPELVVYEMPHCRGGAATDTLVGMSTRIMEVCERFGVQYTPVHSATLKKFATGTGRGDKLDMIRAAQNRRPNYKFIDDNEADAYLLALYARENILGEK